ncbi:hypothetical protein RE428_31750 [Marinobacter nanhaiticus D15-8W]|uniref:Large polyvalent protein associated domain-containing protein n=1 Tax=Marinobacter nanhaiticus D15-8W TaxID=626887 RepID=N6X718_9GAMM|nr:hypothetical protein [Marinobacter nanhaiticus]ENO16933.1 hypothetical protein J057_01640 [Marinobacter nanhaiticus D15-8W]BES72157.1 hypothetical protein RE428_31750 [Marinobacter nanhaiticus D15-8W]
MNKYTEAVSQLTGTQSQEQQTPAPENKYSKAVSSLAEQRRSVLARSVNQAVTEQPDDLAYIRRLSEDTGLSPYIVRENRDDIERRVKQREMGAQIEGFSQPGKEWLSRPDNLGVAQDDLPALRALDDAIANRDWYAQDSVDKLIGSVKTGAINVRQAGSSVAATPALNRIAEFDRLDSLLNEGGREQALGYIRENDRALAGTALKADMLRYIGADDVERADLRAMAQEQISAAGTEIAVQETQRQDIPQDPLQMQAARDGTVGGVLSAIAKDPGMIARLTTESIVTSLPTLAAGALTGPLGAAGASFSTERGLGLVSALRESGIDTTNPDAIIQALTDPAFLEDAQRRSEMKALGVSMLDLVGAGIASRSLSPSSVAGRTLSARQRELINIFAQMPVQGVQEAAGEATGQFLADGEVNQAEVALEAIGGFFGATADVVAFSGGRVFDGIVNNANNYRRAKRDREYLTAVKDAANQSKLRQRDPKAMKELLDRLSESGPVNEMYISGKDFQELFQSNNMDPAEYAQKMESVGEQYYESLVTGGDIAVSVSDFASVIAPTEVADAFIQRSRTKTDGMSPAEADQWIQEQARPALDAIINYDGDQAGAGAQRVYDNVTEQLMATGMDRGAAERHASLYRAFFGVMGEVEGVDPFDLYQQYSLSITRERPGVLQSDDLAALDPLLNRIREGDIPGPDTEDANLRQTAADIASLQAELDRLGIDLQSTDNATARAELGRVVYGTGETNADTVLSQDEMQVDEVTDSEEIRRILDQYQRRQSPEQQVTFRTVGGREVDQSWREATSFRGNDGQPAPLYRGSSRQLTGSDFQPESLGFATQNPSAALGVWFTSDRSDAGRYGNVSEYYADIRNPRVYSSDSIPEFNSAEDAAALREQLKSEGYDGIVFDYTDVDGPIHAIAFEPDQVITGATESFNQDVGGKRGVIRIDRANRNFNIELLANADLSTFLHESGHFFLEVLGDLAQAEGASQRVQGQYQALLDWFGVESREQIGTEQHEQFARGFEAYLMEGKAPTPELQSVFARFRAWLLAIYKRLRALDVDLTDEVRNVMDRILATDEDIERAREGASMTDTLGDIAAMEWTEQERAQYRDVVADAKEAATAELTTRQMKDLRKTNEKWYKDELERVRDEVRQSLNNDPTYQVLAHLQHGKQPDGTSLPDSLNAVKLSRGILVAQYGEAFLKQLPGPGNKQHSGPYLYSREGGIDPQVMADIYGFSSGDELVQTLVASRPMREVVEERATQIMRERYPDINLTGEAAEAAIAAVHNDKAAERMLLELKKLHGKSRFSRNPMTPARVMREAAVRLVNGQRVNDIRPDLYRRAESRAAREAFEAATNSDFDVAFDAKQRQLLNHYLYREAVKARDESESILEYVRRFDKKATRQRIGKAGGEYLEQIDALIDQYEFRRVSLRQIQRRRSLEAWAQEQSENGLDPAIPESVMRQAERVNYKEVPFEELVGIRDAIQSIEHLARTKNKLLSSQYKREFAETVDDIVSSIEASHEIKREPPQFVRGKLSQLKDWGDQYVAAHAKPEFIFEYLDGNKSMGPVWQALFKPMADAENAENRMTGETMEKLTEIMKPFKEEQRAHWFTQKQYLPEVGVSMTKSNMIALALNWGNEGNREAVRRGYDWTDEQVMSVLNRLSQDEWQMVQSIWDLVDSFWPQIAQLQKDLVGVAPEKVESAPIQTRHGTFKGGYYPLKYDPRRSFLQFRRDEGVNTQDLFENNFLRPATKKGHTVERVGSAGQSVRLDMAVLGEHIYQVIHDLTHRKAIIDVDRLLGNVRVRHAIEGSAGREAYRQLRPWLQAIANDTKLPTLPWERVISHMRAGGTIVNMGWKFTTAIVQPLGYLQSVDQIGAKYAWKGLRDFFGSPTKMKKQVDFVFERSEAMKNRQRTFDRDVRDYARKLEREGKMDQVRQSFFWMTGMLDMSVSVPTWLGAYRKAMEGGVENIAKGDEAGAIDYADQAVRESQSSGAVKDLARIQRGNEAFRAFTMFYSYFSALFNLLRRRRQDLSLGNINVPQFAASMALLWLAPAILGELVAGRGPNDDEEWAQWAARQGMLYPLSTMIGLRDVANAVLTPYGFNASPAYDGLDQTARALQIPYKAMTGEELKRTDVKSAVLATSYWGHLPGRQAWITGEYLFDLMEGNERPENPAEFAKGIMFSRPADER